MEADISASHSPPALHITEVLETVLAHLPVRDLLLAQRVCRNWRLLIKDSRYLQQQLFLVPETPCTFWSSEDYMTPEDEPRSRFTRKYPARRDGPRDSIGAFSARLNPLLCIPLDEESKETFYRGWGDMFVVQRDHLSRSRPESSWRKMFLTQPPTRTTCYTFPARTFGLSCIRKKPRGKEGHGDKAEQILLELQRAEWGWDQRIFDDGGPACLRHFFLPQGALISTTEEENEPSFSRLHDAGW